MTQCVIPFPMKRSHTASIFFILTAISPAMAATAPVKTTQEKTQTWINHHCKETGTCDLKSLSLTQSEYQVTLKESIAFGTRMVSEYKTTHVDSLEKYGLAQFIKGCQFSSNGRKKELNIDRNWGQGISNFVHRQWVLDRVSSDPLDWGFDDNSPIRHFFYRWNSTSNSHEKETQHYYGKERPSQPALYVRDLPGTAFEMDGDAKNISLQFKVCIYKTEDVPLHVNAEDLNFAKPLACLNWNSSWIYNHEQGKFEQPLEIDSICK